MIQPPEWISQESWEAFHVMRKSIKAPLTAYAEKLVIVELIRLRGKGHDPQACLDQSIRLGWRDVWPLKDREFARAASSAADDTRAYLEEQSSIKADPSRVRKAIGELRAGLKRVA